MGEASLERRQSAQLNSNAVQSGNRRIHDMLTVSRPDRPANWPGQPLFLQPFLVTDIGFTATLLSRRQLLGESPRQDRFRGTKVAFHM